MRSVMLRAEILADYAHDCIRISVRRDAVDRVVQVRVYRESRGRSLRASNFQVSLLSEHRNFERDLRDGRRVRRRRWSPVGSRDAIRNRGECRVVVAMLDLCSRRRGVRCR